MARNKAYYKAERKIEETRRSGATELSLLGIGKKLDTTLTELPESLGRLTQLQSLKLSHNQLTALPEWLKQLKQLRLLHVEHNWQLRVLPEWLGQLTQLSELWLAGIQLTALPESMGHLTQLKALWVNANNLTELPEWLSRLKQMRGLFLSNNQLTTIPTPQGEFALGRNLKWVKGVSGAAGTADVEQRGASGTDRAACGDCGADAVSVA